MRVDLLFYQSNFRLLVNMPQVPKLPRMNQTQTQKWFSNLIDWKQPNFRFKVVIERVKASLWESNWFGPGLKCSWDIIGTSSGTPLHSPEIFGIRNHLRGAETFNDMLVPGWGERRFDVFFYESIDTLAILILLLILPTKSSGSCLVTQCNPKLL